jgi:uncharacterized BrkB/YihY/UPF0761 family membrane protein
MGRVILMLQAGPVVSSDAAPVVGLCYTILSLALLVVLFRWWGIRWARPTRPAAKNMPAGRIVIGIVVAVILYLVLTLIRNVLVRQFGELRGIVIGIVGEVVVIGLLWFLSWRRVSRGRR